jgi:hypothetical protein
VQYANFLARGGSDNSLFLAVRNFQQSLAYSGRSSFGDSTLDGRYDAALKKLKDTIEEKYDAAIVNDKANKYKPALDAYQYILRLLATEMDNEIYKNVVRRSNALKARFSES